MGKRRGGVDARGVQLDAEYLALAQRVGEHITEWIESRDSLPDLKFWDHGEVMVGSSLEPLTYEVLARTPDAVALLEYVHAKEPGATIFQARCALAVLGFLAGAEVLSVAGIQAKMALKGVAAVVLFDRTKEAGSAN